MAATRRKRPPPAVHHWILTTKQIILGLVGVVSALGILFTEVRREGAEIGTVYRSFFGPSVSNTALSVPAAQVPLPVATQAIPPASPPLVEKSAPKQLAIKIPPKPVAKPGPRSNGSYPAVQNYGGDTFTRAPQYMDTFTPDAGYVEYTPRGVKGDFGSFDSFPVNKPGNGSGYVEPRR